MISKTYMDSHKPSQFHMHYIPLYEKLEAKPFLLLVLIAGLACYPLLFLRIERLSIGTVGKIDPRPIYFGFWCLMTNTTKLD